jgi:putative oxidoreductase
MHGLDKLVNFNTLVQSYPSEFGFGSYMTLMLSIFTEFCCSLFLITGLLVRLMTIPMIVAMGVAFFDVHDAMMPEGELALIYLIVFVLLFMAGPGRFSVDYLIDMKVSRDKEELSVHK